MPYLPGGDQRCYRSLNFFTDSNMVLHANMSLSIQSIQRHQLGRYTCRADNRLGSDSATVTLQTVGKHIFFTRDKLKKYSLGLLISRLLWTTFFPDIPLFVVRPSDTAALEGTTVTIGCQGQGQDLPVSTWYRIDSQGRRALMPGSFNDIEVTNNGQLIIQVWKCKLF